MKVCFALLGVSCVLAGCGASNSAPADFRTPKEIMEEERKGSVFGKDALTWKWSEHQDTTAEGRTDPLWNAVGFVMSVYPVTFNNFHARLIQTDWVSTDDKPDLRYRFTVRLLGKEPRPDNVDILMMAEKKVGSNWAATQPDYALRKALLDRIVMEAHKRYDETKKN